MSLHRLPVYIAVVCSLLSVPVLAENDAMQSDWLELVKGYKGGTLGAELVELKEGPTPDTQTITLAIPKRQGVDRASIEEVVVIGKMPDKPEPLEITYEWLEDYDNERYGLLIHLRKDSKWPIRLHFNAAGAFATDNNTP